MDSESGLAAGVSCRFGCLEGTRDQCLGSAMSQLRPRLCVLEKGAKGYGFHLHGDKTRPGQFIRLVEPDSPASAAGLRAGDRLVFVNGDSVEGESHQQVVSRIRATAGALQLIVVDPDTAELLKKHNLRCRKEFVTEGVPLPAGDSDSDRGDSHSNGTPRGSSPESRENGDTSSERSGRLSISSSIKVRPGNIWMHICTPDRAERQCWLFPFPHKLDTEITRKRIYMYILYVN